jgi:hypothetical protein
MKIITAAPAKKNKIKNWGGKNFKIKKVEIKTFLISQRKKVI